ncbi:MAG TPA: response regulator [Anaerolineales bacterium]|nr:response regulator [Anaerolineales bacterium]
MKIKEDIMTRKTILIVEDDYNLGKIYTLSLEHAGYKTILNNDGKDVLGAIDEHNPDLLVLDMHVPYSWGPDTIKTLRGDSEKSDMKILVTTADIVVGQILRGQEERVLIKPVQVSRLVQVVEEMLGE